MAFKKGQSGNPRGKKPGTRHKATLAALELLEGDLARKIHEKFLKEERVSGKMLK
jgi:hypothetical protein